jgi:hypothetical protein
MEHPLVEILVSHLFAGNKAKGWGTVSLVSRAHLVHW